MIPLQAIGTIAAAAGLFARGIGMLGAADAEEEPQNALPVERTRATDAMFVAQLRWHGRGAKQHLNQAADLLGRKPPNALLAAVALSAALVHLQSAQRIRKSFLTPETAQRVQGLSKLVAQFKELSEALNRILQQQAPHD